VASRQNRVWLVVAVVWLAFVGRGAFYAAILPIWEGFDEHEHFAYVHHFMTHGALPPPDAHVSAEISQSLKLVPLPWSLRNWPAPSLTHDAYWNLSEEERATRRQELTRIPAELGKSIGAEFIGEAKQPPLYYALASVALRLVAGQPLTTRVLILRLFSILIVSLVIPLAYAVTSRVFGEDVPALMATVLIASMPAFLISVSRVANDCLAIVLFAVLTYALLRSEPWDAAGSLLIGVTLGAGLLTKAYFVAALPAILWAAIAGLLKSPRGERTRTFMKISAAMALAFLIAGWWYLRTLGGHGPVWVDAAPLNPQSSSDLLKSAAQMDWWEGIKNIFNTHVWIGGWSFLSIRSWMYAVFRGILLLALAGGLLRILRERTRLPVVLCLYGGFWAALLYHAFVNWVNAGIPTSTGWYLHAVIVCEVAVIWSALQWLGPGVRAYAMSMIVALFLMLEAYATHFVLIPYYVGLISHRPDTTLSSFHISQALNLGWQQIPMRLAVNKPEFVGAGTVSVLWAIFITAGVVLFVLACKHVSYRGPLSEPRLKRRRRSRR